MKISLKTSFTIAIWAIASVIVAVTTVGRPDNIFILLWVSVPIFCLVVTFLVLDQRSGTPDTQSKNEKN
jgi:hypothetical protein